MADLTNSQRANLAAGQEAMPGGRYPIRNSQDLGNAFKDWVRTGRPPDVAAWIHKRARQLGLPDPISKPQAGTRPPGKPAKPPGKPVPPSTSYDQIIQSAAQRLNKQKG